MEELFERFPEMQPVSGPPSMHTVNGIGTTFYGRRDFDPESGTYVGTHWLVLLFIPIFPLGAYRVLPAESGGWYFLGRVPLSGSAKAWPVGLTLLIGILIAGLAWSNHVNSAEYRDGQRMAEARKLQEAGNLGQAAQLYNVVAGGHTPAAHKAREAIDAMTRSDDLRTHGNLAELLVLYRVAWSIWPKNIGFQDFPLRALRLIEERGAENPSACLELLTLVEPEFPDSRKLLPAREKVLKKLAEEKPDDVEAVSRLCVVYEQRKKLDLAEKLLTPLKAKLGTSEGARILGQIYLAKGNDAEAFKLLKPYADVKLKAFQGTEKAVQDAQKQLNEQVIKELKTGTAQGFDFARANAVDKEEANKLVVEYLRKRFKGDKKLARLQKTLREEGVVIPAAFDLSFIHLRRGQQMKDQAARKAELEKAEKLLGSIQDQVGGRNFNLSMGQVKFWLGKQAEGKKLFDELLKAEKRSFDSLYSVANVYRDLGSNQEARALLEEAYKTAGDQQQLHKAAGLRSLTWKDLDDQIEWLKKCDDKDPQVKATLETSQGRLAQQAGKDDQASRHFTQAIKIYAAQPESPSTLNNGALAHMALFQVTGERESVDQALVMIRKAVSLNPRDSILLSNYADALQEAALYELVKDKVRLKELRQSASTDLLGYLYEDEAGRQALISRVKESPGVKKTLATYERAQVIAPKNLRLYQELKDLYAFLQDRNGLARLVQRFDEASPGLGDLREKSRKYLEGKDDARLIRELPGRVANAARRVEATRGEGGVTFAVAAGTLYGLRCQQLLLGQKVDADALVKLAEEAHKAAPSSTTSSYLEGALLTRVHLALTAQVPDYAAMAKRTRRSMGAPDLVVVALGREGKTREAVLANPDFKRAVEMVRAGRKKTKGSSSGWTWAVLRATHPGEAAALAENLKTDEQARLERELTGRLSVMNVSHAFRTAWVLESAGKTKEAKDVLKACAAEGAAMPYDLP
jgi:Flp pilus assembly protein TadD